MNSDLYHTELVARAREAFGEGRIAAAAASITVDNPLCGDRVTLDLEKSDGKVKAIGHEVKGCLLCAAAAATIAAFGQNRSPAELREMALAAKALMKDGTAVPERFAGLRVFTPVHAAKSRRDCVLLPFEALGKALDAAF
ncbi:iron-sulfur cluster assembly scaffold protein [Dongia sp.]|uniref:iron-sulfur cluster assembly scaffold protein n=1 Tax=Dongia sp. TaxID=1977262 RepID=UPI0037521D0E